MAPTTSREDIRARILAVDDELLNLELLERSLRKTYDVLTASTPGRALELLAEQPDVAVILSDYRMPGMTGTELLSETMASHPDTKRVIITGYADSDAVARAADAGEVDFVIKKPWRHKQLHQLLQQFVAGYHLARENRSLSHDLRDANEALDARDEVLATSLDDQARELVAKQRELTHVQRELEARRFRDPITGLYSRRAFHTRLREELARTRRYEREVALLVVELDDFDGLLERLGPDRSDTVLREIAHLLVVNESTRVRDSDVVARVDGPAFAILLVETAHSGAALKASRLREAVARTQFVDGMTLTMSAGIACAPDDAADAESLLAKATDALVRARRAGRNRQARCVADDPDGAGANPLPRIPTLDTGAFRMAHTMVSEVARGMTHGRSREAVYIDMSPLARLRPVLGDLWHASAHEHVAETLGQMLGAEFDVRDRLCRTPSQDFVCLLAVERHPDTEPRDLDGVALAVADKLAHALAPQVPRDLRDLGLPSTGVASVLSPGSPSAMDSSQLLQSLLCDARDSAVARTRARGDELERGLTRAMAADRITVAFQPVVALERAEIVAYQAQPRGPARTPMESFRALDAIARGAAQNDREGLLSGLCRCALERALRSASGLAAAHKLLVRISPHTLYDTSFMQARLGAFLTQTQLTPGHLVLCVSEQDALEHFVELRRALPVYASKGIAFAIEDLGTQGAAIEALARLEPRLLLLSPIFTQELATSRHKRALMRSLVQLAESLDATPVAQAVDHPDDPRVLLDVGVRHGIGNFLARPGSAFPRLRAAVKRTLASTLDPHGSIFALPLEPASDHDGEP